MYSVIRRYQGNPSDLDELFRLVRDQGQGLITSVPGFIAYTLVRDDQGQGGSLGVFDDKKGADESTRRAAQFVRERLPNLRLQAPSVIEGPVVVRKVTAAPSSFIVTRRYQFDPKDIDEIVRRVETGFVPIISQSPGFCGYAVIDAGDGVLVTVSTFESQQQSERSVQDAREWVQQNLSSMVKGPPEVWAARVTARWRRPTA